MIKSMNIVIELTNVDPNAGKAMITSFEEGDTLMFCRGIHRHLKVSTMTIQPTEDSVVTLEEIALFRNKIKTIGDLEKLWK